MNGESKKDWMLAGQTKLWSKVNKQKEN